jgi:hypothetical protein
VPTPIITVWSSPDVDGARAPKRSREDQAERALVGLAQVLVPLHRREDVEADGPPVALVQQIVLPEQLYRAIARSMDPDLRAGQKPVSQLETDLRPVVEPEEIRQQIAEVSLSERAREAVRHAERGFAPGHAQRRGQRHEGEVRLQRVHRDIGVRLLRLRIGRLRRRRCLRERGRRRRDEHHEGDKNGLHTLHVVPPHGKGGAATEGKRQKSSGARIDTQNRGFRLIGRRVAHDEPRLPLTRAVTRYRRCKVPIPRGIWRDSS